jgi:hypothetical protein
VSVILVSISVDATRFANSQLCDLLRLSFFFLWNHRDVQVDTVACQLVMHSSVVMGFPRRIAASLIVLQAHIKSLLVLGSDEAASALILVNHNTL